MGETARYTTLKKIINQYSDEAMQSQATYRRLYGIATRGVTDLSLDVIGTITTRKICVDGNKTAQLPDDYLQWSKVGVLNAIGEVATLKINPSLTTYGSNSTSRLSQNTDGTSFDDGLISDLFYLNFIDSGYGYYGVRLFGVSGNEAMTPGHFNIDEQCGIIILDNRYDRDYIILEYLAMPDENTNIPIQAQEALIAWIAWRDIVQLAASRKVSVYDKTERRRTYFREKNLARNRLKPFRKQDAIDASQDAIRLVPKG
jgi:hypothetical protein